MSSKLEALLIRHEGLKLKPYRDSVGKLTIGVGRNLDDRGITRDEAMVLLANDIEIASDDLIAILGPHTFAAMMNETRWNVLISMVFNMGKPRFAKFKKLIAAVKKQDWMLAAQEMQDSKWAGQVGNRAVELCWMMRNGKPWVQS